MCSACFHHMNRLTFIYMLYIYQQLCNDAFNTKKHTFLFNNSIQVHRCFFHMLVLTVGLLTFLEVLLVKEEQTLDQVEC